MERRKKGGCQVRHPPFQQFTNHKTTTTMKETIFSVIDYINRNCIDDSCWGLQTIYEEHEDNNTSKIFGAKVKEILPRGTYLYLYLTKEQLSDICYFCQQPTYYCIIDDAIRMTSTPWLAIWKLI